MLLGPGRQTQRWAPALLAIALPTTGCGEDHSLGFTARSANVSIESLDVWPQGRALFTGDSLVFVPVARDGQGRSVGVRVYWSATGGSIDERGVFVADTMAGSYQVMAETRAPDPALVAVASGSVSSVPAPEPPLELPSVEPAPVDADDVLFMDTFETRDFRKWGENAPLGDPFATGQLGDGAHIGFGFVTGEMAHTGSYAWRAQVDPLQARTRPNWPIGKSSLERWRILDGVRDFTVSAWYFFPADYPDGVWTNLMQLKERQPPHDPSVVIAINQSRKLILYEGIRETTLRVSSTVPPAGRWINITTRFVVDRYRGRVTTWLDGVKVFDVSGINTLGNPSTRDVYFGVGNYVAAKGVQRCHLYIDDVVVSLKPPD